MKSSNGRKIALIIGCNDYSDKTLSQLKMPTADAQGLATLLLDPKIGGFDNVSTLLNPPFDTALLAVADLYADKNKDDLLLLYFSGHGILDNYGRLYLAVTNTRRNRLSGTAIFSNILTNEMDCSRSKRQILILDCCHSGAFHRGAKSEIQRKAITEATFEGNGYGRIVLTATDATQIAWEGDKISGDINNSLFTYHLTIPSPKSKLGQRLFCRFY